MAMLTQSLALVPLTRLLTWSMAPFAADRADDRPRALMIAAQRFWHCGTKVFSSHARSVIVCGAGLPLIFALVKSGYCVLEWLPQMVMQVTASFSTPAFCASAD